MRLHGYRRQHGTRRRHSRCRIRPRRHHCGGGASQGGCPGVTGRGRYRAGVAADHHGGVEPGDGRRRRIGRRTDSGGLPGQARHAPVTGSRAPGRNRTYDRRIRSPVLYPTELRRRAAESSGAATTRTDPTASIGVRVRRCRPGRPGRRSHRCLPRRRIRRGRRCSTGPVSVRCCGLPATRRCRGRAAG
jgi:hypothetical protein